MNSIDTQISVGFALIALVVVVAIWAISKQKDDDK